MGHAGLFDCFTVCIVQLAGRSYYSCQEGSFNEYAVQRGETEASAPLGGPTNPAESDGTQDNRRRACAVFGTMCLKVPAHLGGLVSLSQ